MKALRPHIETETDLLIDAFVESGSGDLAHVAWRQPGIVFFKYVLGMPIDDVPLCVGLTDTALNGATEEERMGAWGGLYQHLHDAVTARTQEPPRDDMIDVLINAEIDGERLPFNDVVANAMLLVQAGLVRKNSLGASHANYEPARDDEHHDHLICLCCNQVVEFYRSDLERLQEKVCREHGYRLVHHSLQIFGVCPACQSRADETKIRNKVAQLHT
ncbi:MAG: Ferric uptake regulation protein [Acidobacteria bacterium ADurb.Bin340]|nr:MAG: Ferric uptake regulation protein [Acidobacteria bacterium ADurb.Bin340]